MSTDCKSEDISILPEAKIFNLKKKNKPTTRQGLCKGSLDIPTSTVYLKIQSGSFHGSKEKEAVLVSAHPVRKKKQPGSHLPDPLKPDYAATSF